MRIIEVHPENSLRVVHPESQLAHRYLDGLQGIEIGAAAYAPFGLDSLNISRIVSVTRPSNWRSAAVILQSI